eukprot:m.190371 g.190371  ORF g.190371 m.190371 type:complete len:1410 (+) comp18025_c0_seq1:226-4455(+)
MADNRDNRHAGGSTGHDRHVSLTPVPAVQTSFVCTFIGSETVSFESIMGASTSADGSTRSTQPTKLIEDTANSVVRKFSANHAPNSTRALVAVNHDRIVVQAVGEGDVPKETLSSCGVSSVVYCGKGSQTPQCFALVNRIRVEQDSLQCQVFLCDTATHAHERVSALAKSFAAVKKRGTHTPSKSPAHKSPRAKGHSRSASSGSATSLTSTSSSSNSLARPASASGHKRASSIGGRLTKITEVGAHDTKHPPARQGSSPASKPKAPSRQGSAVSNGSTGSSSSSKRGGGGAGADGPPGGGERPQPQRSAPAPLRSMSDTVAETNGSSRSISSPSIHITESTSLGSALAPHGRLKKKMTNPNLGAELNMDLIAPKSPCGLLDERSADKDAKSVVKRRAQAAASAGGCMIRAMFVGERKAKMPSGNADELASRQAQKWADNAIDDLSQSFDESRRRRVAITVRTEMVRIANEDSGNVIADIARVRVRTCAGGQGDAKEYFVISSRDHTGADGGTPPSGIAFTFRVFQSESEIEAKMALDALARAFGATDSSNRLSAALSPGMSMATLRKSSAIIEKVFVVSYYGFMELVSSKMDVSIKACITMQTGRVAAVPCEIRLGPTTIEFYDTNKMALAKWFPVEDIDAVMTQGSACAVLISRGSWKKLRFCCYVVTVENEIAATHLKDAVLDRVQRRRDTIRDHAFTNVLSHLNWNGDATKESDRRKREDALQAEVNRLKEDYQISLDIRFRVEMINFETDQRSNVLVGLLSQLYTSCKPTEVRQNRSLLGKSKKGNGWSLSTSVESLLNKRLDRRRSRAKSSDEAVSGGAKSSLSPGRDPSNLSAMSGSPEYQAGAVGGSGAQSTPNSANNSPVTMPKLLRKPSGRSLRQDLYRSVSSTDPRAATPRRRRSSISPGTVSPVNLARQRWVKAVQQQLLLIRMAKENARIEEENDKIREMSTERNAEKRWEDLLAADATAVDEMEIRMCLREGVPPRIRRKFWLFMVKWLADKTTRSLPEPSYTYIDLVVQPAIYWHAIKIDLERTFPTNPYYREGGKGLRALFKVMKAYSNYDTEVGYCQGMGFMAGLFLNQLTEENAFRAFMSVMFHHGFRHQYAHDMATLKVQLYQLNRLLLDHLPAVSTQFRELNVEPFLYATSWFLTLYCSQFPLPFCNFVLDNVLLEGMTFVFKVAMALFLTVQEELLACSDFETTLMFIQKELPQRNNQDVMDLALDMSTVTAEALDDYASEFELLHSTMGELAFEKNVTKDDQIQLLMDRLLGQDKAYRDVTRELELCKQQLNHAKSAVQGLTLENERLESELRSYRRTSMSTNPPETPRTSGGSVEVTLTSGPVASGGRKRDVLQRRKSEPGVSALSSHSAPSSGPVSPDQPGMPRRNRRRSISGKLAIAEVVQKAQF